MKRAVSLLLVLIMCLSMCACGNSNKKAFEVSKAAYDNIDIAYDIADNMGSDLYEAWRLGIYDDEEILEDGVKHLAKELSLSEDELSEGVAYVIAVNVYDKEWSALTDEEKETYRGYSDYAFSLFEEDLFSFCVMVVSGAYEVKGDTKTAQEALNSAKAQMKELSESYSDYEHYPNLKGYYTTTSSFFDFCQNPTGSFEQVKTTINDYRNEARDYISDLDYIFEE